MLRQARVRDPLRPQRSLSDVVPIVWFASLAVVLGTAAFALAISAASVFPEFCAACHGGVAQRLSAGAHEASRCDDCHMEGGVYGLAENRLAIVSMIPAALLPYASVSLPAKNDSCLQCHDAVLREDVTLNGIRMSHREVDEDNWTCTRCHAFRIHAKEPDLSLRRYSMGDCLRCHNANPGNIGTCDVCHIGGEQKDANRSATASLVTPWRVTHGPNWEKTHGMGDLATCSACHPDDYCVRCHGMALPHPAGFAKIHGSVVLASDDGGRGCVTCHRETTCDDCHGVTMPHPDQFVRRHPSDVEATGEAVCERCHERSSCDRCHVSHVHPGLPEDYLRALQERPVRP